MLDYVHFTSTNLINIKAQYIFQLLQVFIV